MNTLSDIIERCHQRQVRPLRQRRTIKHNKKTKHQYTVYCAHKCPIRLSDLEKANISFMPIGRAPHHDHGPWDFTGRRFLKRQKMKDWQIDQWQTSWGIQIYTGSPSEYNGANWHDLVFHFDAICKYPEAVEACITGLINATTNPLLTVTANGGLRFSCRITDYLHQKSEEERYYIYKHTPTSNDPYNSEVYLEIIGEKGYSCWDARYEIILGNILEPPVMDLNVMQAHIDTLRNEIHQPIPPRKNLKPLLLSVNDIPDTLGSQKLDLAKEALLKRGFTYAHNENGVFSWYRRIDGIDTVLVSLWEEEGAVWIRASKPKVGLPTEATHITDVWVDTGIKPKVSDKLRAVRDGKLSPLSLKRPKTVLHKSKHNKIEYETQQEQLKTIQNVFEKNIPIQGLVASRAIRKKFLVEYFSEKSDKICLIYSTLDAADAAAKYLQENCKKSIGFWRPRRYRWEQVKDIPVKDRMENPFQYGNVCEDSDRCLALEKKGGDPLKSICPQCQVYTECKVKGYLSQTNTIKRKDIQIIPCDQVCFDPNYKESMDKIYYEPELNENNEDIINSDRLFVIEDAYIENLFPKYSFDIKVLDEWSVNWEGYILGNFAKALLNVLRLPNEIDCDSIRRVRATIQAFNRHEQELIYQMCHININANVIPNGLVDAESGKELAHYTILFEGGTSAYIPLDNDAVKILEERNIPYLELHDFTIRQKMKIPITMETAIKFGVLNIETLDCIDTLPSVCENPNWTIWHQLKCLFDYYHRDDDITIEWDEKQISFRLPPVLHSSIKRLLLSSNKIRQQYIQAAFPNETIKTTHIKTTEWCSSHRVFQLRSGCTAFQSLIEYDTNIDMIRPTNTGRQFIYSIRSEIDRDIRKKHAIFTYDRLIDWLYDISEKENVCFVRSFAETLTTKDEHINQADVIWIIGIPIFGQGNLWKKAQLLYGNDTEPLSYTIDLDTVSYKDKRVQYLFEQHVISFYTHVLDHAKLTQQTNKTILIGTSFYIPDITDRPETLLFDWEDLDVAGGLHKLAEAIQIRKHYEEESKNITAEISRNEVERILGCSPRQANRILNKLRGGNISRVTFREQILSLLADGEKRTAEIVDAIDGHPKAINSELTRLVTSGVILKPRHGIYKLPTT